VNDLNAIFNEFARAFVGTILDDSEVAFPGRLKRQLLDGSVESLHEVDRYLSLVHKKRHKISNDEWHITVLRAGAYVGEVIRHAAPEGFFNWVDYNDYMLAQPSLREIIPERTSATCALLVAPDGSMSMPLNKIARYIAEGAENSVHFFALCDLKKVSKGSAS
jgi:hypothetical protein